MKYKEIRENKEINAYLKKGDANLGLLGFTDHSQAHEGIVCRFLCVCGLNSSRNRGTILTNCLIATIRNL